jgi:PAS domain S-box-containing protein
MPPIDWNQEAMDARSILQAIEDHEIPFVEGVIPTNSDSDNPYVKRLKHAISAVLAQGLDGRLVQYNLATQGVFGHTPEEAIGQSALELLVPERLWDDRNSRYIRLLLSEYTKLEIQSTIRINKFEGEIDIHAWVFSYKINPGPYSVAASVERI